jgi:hypothetical protein
MSAIAFWAGAILFAQAATASAAKASAKKRVYGLMVFIFLLL